LSKLSVEIIEKEALKGAWSVCKIVPAELGDKVGDVASLSVAIDGFFKINIEKNIEKNECR
jgi:glucokinase